MDTLSQIRSDKIIIVLLLLASMNFMLLGSYLVVATFLLMVMIYGCMDVDATAWLLVAFAFAYVLFTMFQSESSFSSLLRIAIYPIAYIIGLTLSNGMEMRGRCRLIVYISLAMASHSILSFVYNFSQGGLATFSDGRSVDVWSGTLSTATGQASYYYCIVAILPFILYGAHKSYLKVLGVLVYTVCLFHDILLDGRSFLVLSLISVVAGTIIFIVNSDEKRNIWKLLFAILVATVITVICFQNNIGGIRDVYESSYFYHRFFSETASDITETSRWMRKLTYIRNMFNYPFGGNHIRNDLGVGYSHELWLDTFDDAGWTPYILCWAFTIASIRKFWRIIVDKRINVDYKVLIGSFMVTMNAAFFIEPILSGCPMTFMVYCLASGLMSDYSLVSNTDIYLE
ncbi:MAG: hypothetical protein LUH23_07235 [Oscillospiraceae bacterium]|nr:hypothetical protein [Oscillospiraceae bacterium]